MNFDIKKRLVIFFGVLVIALLFLAPTVFREEMKGMNWLSKPISLGLDLSGGVYLVYEVQTKEAVKSRLQQLGNSIKANLTTKKIPVLRPRVNDLNQIEVPLVSDLSLENAKKTIDEEFREISFVSKSDEAGKIKLVYGISEQQAEKIEHDSVTQAIETLRTRVDQFGVAEPLIQRGGDKRIILQMPGVSDIESVKRVVGNVAKLEFRLVATSASKEGSVSMKNRDGGTISVEDQALMTGDAVASASVVPQPGQVEVVLKLTSDGGKTFRRITSENVGRQLAIILDGEVRSAPVINETIGGGEANIHGRFSMEEARELAVVLRAGALPAPLKSVEERTVGPSLGQESIQKGVLAMLIGFVGIMLFMVIYYAKSGWMAVGTLVLNVILVLAMLSFFGATLTLPGLAGLALTVGMAVDANVLIFERIRDELRNGVTRDAAVVGGFHKAWSAIVDANVTHLLSGLILYYFGTGPVRGFAVMLCIGIITTLYCATFVAQLAFDFFQFKGRNGLSI